VPVYAIKTPKGVYKLEAPKGSRDEDLIATLRHHAPEAFVKPQGDALGDFGNYLKQGAVASTQSITDIAGLNNPASQWLEKQKQGIKFSEAAKAKQSEADYYNQASKGKGVLREGLGALQSFAANPEALAGQAVGSLAPFALPVAAGVAAASAPVTAPVAAGLAGLATVGGGALGAAAGAGGMKRSMYDAVKEELTNAGVDPKEAEAAAQKAGAYSGSNAALLGGGALLGILGGVTGLTGTAAKTITSRVAATLAAKKVGEEVAEGAAERVVAGAAAKEAGKSIGKEMLKDVGVEASTEALENAYQQLGTNVALSGE
jgi:hypothetical protein